MFNRQTPKLLSKKHATHKLLAACTFFQDAFVFSRFQKPRAQKT